MNSITLLVCAVGLLASEVLSQTNTPLALPAPPYRFRRVGEKFCDLGPILDWQQRCAIVNRYNSQITAGRAARGTRLLKEPPNPMPKWSSSALIVYAKQSGLLIIEHKRSRAIRVSQGRPGALGDALEVGSMPSASSFSALTNYPGLSTVQVGRMIFGYSIQIGQVEYRGKQIPLYDHGVPYVPSNASETNAVRNRQL